MFKRVLIANRGEIAIRIARAASELGLESVSVHASVDRLALHTRYTTETREITGEGAIGAYLSIDEMLRVASETGCDCVHPGYGFLSENPEFAQRCQDVGLTFVGPSPEALTLFGDKVASRDLAVVQGIPVVPGSDSTVTSADDAAAFAVQVGFPVMLKAAAGGGGRGMRAVHAAEELAEAFERCQSEAEAAFGNGAMFVEKLVERPRHIEVQVLADSTGTYLSFFLLQILRY